MLHSLENRNCSVFQILKSLMTGRFVINLLAHYEHWCKSLAIKSQAQKAWCEECLW